MFHSSLVIIMGQYQTFHWSFVSFENKAEEGGRTMLCETGQHLLS